MIVAPGRRFENIKPGLNLECRINFISSRFIAGLRPAVHWTSAPGAATAVVPCSRVTGHRVRVTRAVGNCALQCSTLKKKFKKPPDYPAAHKTMAEIRLWGIGAAAEFGSARKETLHALATSFTPSAQRSLKVLFGYKSVTNATVKVPIDSRSQVFAFDCSSLSVGAWEVWIDIADFPLAFCKIWPAVIGSASFEIRHLCTGARSQEALPGSHLYRRSAPFR